MRHQSQKNFRGMFVGIPQHQKGYLIYVPSTRKIVSSHDVVFDKYFSSALAYMSRPYSEAIMTQPAVLYIPYATSSHEQNGDIITFEYFEEGNLVENKCNLEEGESSLDSIDESSTEDESDDGYISMNALKYIWYGSQIHPDINERYARLKIHGHINKKKIEW